jgi:hypothetical protein
MSNITQALVALVDFVQVVCFMADVGQEGVFPLCGIVINC